VKIPLHIVAKAP